MKRVLLIGMLILAMGSAGCFYRSHDRDRYQNDRGRYEENRGYHDQDRGHDYEHHDHGDQGYGDHR